jgi:hypothetical protein
MFNVVGKTEKESRHQIWYASTFLLCAKVLVIMTPALLLSLSLFRTHTRPSPLYSKLTHSLLVEYHRPLYSPVKHQFLVSCSNRGKRTKHIFCLLNDSKTIVLSGHLKEVNVRKVKTFDALISFTTSIRVSHNMRSRF